MDNGMTAEEESQFLANDIYSGLLSEPGYHIPDNVDTKVIEPICNYLTSLKSIYTPLPTEDERVQYDSILIHRWPKYKREHLDIAINKCNNRLNPPYTRPRGRSLSRSASRGRSRSQTRSRSRGRSASRSASRGRSASTSGTLGGRKTRKCRV